MLNQQIQKQIVRYLMQPKMETLKQPGKPLLMVRMWILWTSEEEHQFKTLFTVII